MKRTQLFHLIFTEPGKVTLVQPCTLSGANISVGEEGGLGRGAECIAVSMWTLRRREGKEGGKGGEPLWRPTSETTNPADSAFN